MESAAASIPQPKSLEARKLQLLIRIAQTEDEQLIALWEDIIFDIPEAGDEVTDEEIALVEARIAEFRANPDDFVTLDDFAKQLKQGK
jgi:hypothetical protein